MILLLGATGYIGSEFAREMNLREIPWITVGHGVALEFLQYNPAVGLVINCAAFIPKESVSQCDQHPDETIQGNLLLPSNLANVCAGKNITLAHVSTGCLWSDGQEHSEDDPPQRSFSGHCGFYIGTKVLAEREVRKCDRHYIWRVRLPFDEVACERNYLSKLARFPEVYDHENSISHRGDFVKACLDSIQFQAPFGTYNVTNPGSISAREVVEQLVKTGIRKDRPKFLTGLQGGSRLCSLKLERTGVKIRPVADALAEALKNWR